ncbi:hypothetical protein L2E82_50748 [Cichorium intybus]|nr:hypothetical protein L2E82_50748 [Cichorium intybus]
MLDGLGTLPRFSHSTCSSFAEGKRTIHFLTHHHTHKNISLISEQVSLILRQIDSSQKKLAQMEKQLLGYESIDLSTPNMPNELKLFLQRNQLPLGKDSRTGRERLTGSRGSPQFQGRSRSPLNFIRRRSPSSFSSRQIIPSPPIAGLASISGDCWSGFHLRYSSSLINSERLQGSKIGLFRPIEETDSATFLCFAFEPPSDEFIKKQEPSLSFQSVEINEYANNPETLLLEAIHSGGYSGALANPLLASECSLNRLNSSILEEFVAILDEKLALKYKNANFQRRFIRLEQSANGFMKRDMTSWGNFAILQGWQVIYYIKKPKILMGRATKDVIVDVDLVREGDCRISRRQSISAVKPLWRAAECWVENLKFLNITETAIQTKESSFNNGELAQSSYGFIARTRGILRPAVSLKNIMNDDPPPQPLSSCLYNLMKISPLKYELPYLAREAEIEENEGLKKDQKHIQEYQTVKSHCFNGEMHKEREVEPKSQNLKAKTGEYD